VTKGEFIAFWVGSGKVLAGINVNIWDQTDAIQALVRSGVHVARSMLVDPSVSLTDLVSGAPAPSGARS